MTTKPKTFASSNDKNKIIANTGNSDISEANTLKNFIVSFIAFYMNSNTMYIKFSSNFFHTLFFQSDFFCRISYLYNILRNIQYSLTCHTIEDYPIHHIISTIAVRRQVWVLVSHLVGVVGLVLLCVYKNILKNSLLI